MLIPWHSPHITIFINQLMETEEIYWQETLQKSRNSFNPFLVVQKWQLESLLGQTTIWNWSPWIILKICNFREGQQMWVQNLMHKKEYLKFNFHLWTRFSATRNVFFNPFWGHFHSSALLPLTINPESWISWDFKIICKTKKWIKIDKWSFSSLIWDGNQDFPPQISFELIV